MRRTAGLHVLAVAAIGVAAGVVAGLLYRGAIGPLAGFDVSVLAYLAFIWIRIWPLDAEATSSHASSEDPSRPVSDLALLLAAVASLGGVATLMVKANSAHGSVRDTEIGIAIAAVVVSWVLVHTIFTLKYARMYYATADDTQRGVDFENKVRPPYSDFAYLAFTIGMTFQVSDTDLQSVAYRRLALRHALLSYLFGAVILATAINVGAGLVS
ncbi:MAG TPA: DUF1345 domain-containing protein [Mycobacteriales bacterium]|nr:DUF1345 domain-containing protein [Mycobacteriales bacterium]